MSVDRMIRHMILICSIGDWHIHRLRNRLYVQSELTWAHGRAQFYGSHQRQTNATDRGHQNHLCVCARACTFALRFIFCAPSISVEASTNSECDGVR